MSYAKTFLVTGSILMFTATWADARSSRRRSRRSRRSKSTKPKTSSDSNVLYMGRADDGEKPVAWMTDFDEAAKLAREKKRGIMVLFTSEELMQKSTSCRFAANSVRRAVRKADVVPVRLVPPARTSHEGLGEEEIAKREEFFKKATERYRELVGKYEISKGPSLVFTAPDETRVSGLVAPEREAITVAMGQLGELIEAHQKAMAEKEAAKKPTDPPKAKAADDAEPDAKPAADEVPKPAEDRDPGGEHNPGGEEDDDF